MEPGMFDGLLVKGALMAIGAGGATAFLGLIGWILVQFILAKYGRKKNGNANQATDYVTASACTAHHEEMKDLIRDGFEKVGEKTAAEFAQVREEIKEDIGNVYSKIWDHATDHVAHGGGQ